MTSNTEMEPGIGWVLRQGPDGWLVGWSESTNAPQEKYIRNQLQEAANRMNYLENSKDKLERQVQEDKEELASLREEVKLFSTFEQICNSGMLRNFKIDPEGDFAQVILGLLQRTMELQINHLAGPSWTVAKTPLSRVPTPELEAS